MRGGAWDCSSVGVRANAAELMRVAGASFRGSFLPCLPIGPSESEGVPGLHGTGNSHNAPDGYVRPPCSFPSRWLVEMNLGEGAQFFYARHRCPSPGSGSIRRTLGAVRPGGSGASRPVPCRTLRAFSACFGRPSTLWPLGRSAVLWSHRRRRSCGRLDPAGRGFQRFYDVFGLPPLARVPPS